MHTRRTKRNTGNALSARRSIGLGNGTRRRSSSLTRHAASTAALLPAANVTYDRFICMAHTPDAVPNFWLVLDDTTHTFSSPVTMTLHGTHHAPGCATRSTERGMYSQHRRGDDNQRPCFPVSVSQSAERAQCSTEKVEGDKACTANGTAYRLQPGG